MVFDLSLKQPWLAVLLQLGFQTLQAMAVAVPLKTPTQDMLDVSVGALHKRFSSWLLIRFARVTQVYYRKKKKNQCRWKTSLIQLYKCHIQKIIVKQGSPLSIGRIGQSGMDIPHIRRTVVSLTATPPSFVPNTRMPQGSVFGPDTSNVFFF